MNQFAILGNIESVVGEFEFSTKGKTIVIGRAMTDEQIDAALYNISNMVGNIFHSTDKTIIEMA